MSVQYEKALQAWGAKKLQAAYHSYGKAPVMVDKKTVLVEMDFNEGCCEPGSYYESPTANVKITGMGSINNSKTIHLQTSIDHYSFDFVQILGEIVDAGDGVLSREDR